MKTKFVEVTNNNKNWGKFMLIQFDTEWTCPSTMAPGYSLLISVGWNRNQIWVLDLQTCEGVAVLPGGLASADLEKHKCWVCPMYEPFIEWLYQQTPKDGSMIDLDTIPTFVNLPNAEFAMAGYRRSGKGKKGKR